MPSIQYTARYRKNTGLVISPSELIALHFYGMNIESTTGTFFSNEVMREYCVAAQREIEEYLGIKIEPQLVSETIDYNRDDYLDGFPILNTSFPVRRTRSLIGFLGKHEQTIYPEDWLLCRTNNQQEFTRHINIVPTGSNTTVTGGDIILTGLLSQVGLRSNRNIPAYWNVQYETGYTKLPVDLLTLISYLAAIPVLAIAGDLIFKVPGIASQSLGIDGLSASISTTSSATSSGYASRILEYRKTIDATLKRITINYRGISFTVI